jgi:2-polyprenyl-3-methyl-5-hydroxy-6-metoxy-1,4-benzoquinol methylase
MSVDLDSWNKAASGWDRDIARPGSYRTHLITGAMTDLLAEIKGKQVLDAGCGNGFFTNWLSSQGAMVEGVDGSEEMIKLARASYPSLKFEVADLTKPVSEDSGKYDYIVANMLLMHMDNVSTFIAEAYRLLKADGRLIFSILHPCFNEPTSKLYKSLWDKITGAKPSAIAFNYYMGQQGRYESHMNTKLTHYHRTLEKYSQELHHAGFAITQMIEPHHLPKEFLELHPKLEYAERLPRFIFFNCQPL